jgi:hypothetical protein
VSGCATTESRINRNNDFAVAKVNSRCEALQGNPEYYAQCQKASEAFLNCYAEKLGSAAMPSEAWAVCRVAVDSHGKVEPGLSANPRKGDERFGVNRPYDGYYNRTYGGYNGNGYYGGYSGGYRAYGDQGYRRAPVNPTVVNRVGPMFTVEGSTPGNRQVVLQPQAPVFSQRAAQCATSREGAIALYGPGACP